MRKRNLLPILVAALGLLMTGGAPGASWGASTLQKVKAWGWLACGASQGLPAFSNPDRNGRWTDLDVDFCRAVADRVVLMDEGRIVEQSPPGRFFSAPQSERGRLFLSRILYN